MAALPSVLAALGVAGGSIPAQYAVNLTVYHVNPRHLGPIPINMDTGDAAGDMFFDLKDTVPAQAECQGTTSAHSHACTNQEVQAADLVYNKLTIEVDSRFGLYAMCNVGNSSNLDPFGDKCQKDTYCCMCRSPGSWNKTVPCGSSVGSEDAGVFFSHIGRHCSSDDPAYMCYMTNLGRKYNGTPAMWYSTLRSGYCPLASAGESCSWRVLSVDKIINATCHKDMWYTAVEQQGSDCFSQCGPQRNTSSTCWVNCFYETALGPGASRPGGPISGIPLEKMIGMWKAPFEPHGGCPALPQQPPAEQRGTDDRDD
eukprot:TRINITY_DN20477_c0_g2_i1.p1 TRINITY_DN20477_c0_g2~~TRINITY_DN20477_c0_g2_i1.p1  ORF type:complete len:339 (+),score=82.73 TRINITY_DN20477_c0_g2_i1:79-1017(+)